MTVRVSLDDLLHARRMTLTELAGRSTSRSPICRSSRPARRARSVSRRSRRSAARSTASPATCSPWSASQTKPEPSTVSFTRRDDRDLDLLPPPACRRRHPVARRQRQRAIRHQGKRRPPLRRVRLDLTAADKSGEARRRFLDLRQRRLGQAHGDRRRPGVGRLRRHPDRRGRSATSARSWTTWRAQPGRSSARRASSSATLRELDGRRRDRGARAPRRCVPISRGSTRRTI